MARAKAAPEPPRKRRINSVRNPAGRPRLPSALTLKGGEAWRAWLAEIATQERRARTEVIDAALAVYASRHGYKSPPSREA